jgi:phosphate starvation-inducible PhoH-like protein
MGGEDIMSSVENVQTPELGVIPKKEPKKRAGRKSKKQIEKEMMFDYLEYEKEKNQKKNLNNEEHGTGTKKTIAYVSGESTYTTPKNTHQKQYVNLLKDKTKKIVITTGPAGTGKTLFATEYGVRNFLAGNCDKLIFTRPSVSVDEELGFLPGTLEEKMAPWVRPIYDVLYNFITPKEVQALMEEKWIEIAPLGYMRGRTFKNAWIVADEMQNSTLSQMKMLLTRLGENSRMIITGDLEQYDKIGEVNGLEDFLTRLSKTQSSSICSFVFQKSDIQREEVVSEVLDIYANHDANAKISSK